MTVFDAVILCIFLVFAAYNIYMLLRILKVLHNRQKIFEAICNYQCFCVKNDTPIEVEFDDVEEYDETLYKRPFDFSCEHILPKEKYEIIKGFM